VTTHATACAGEAERQDPALDKAAQFTLNLAQLCEPGFKVLLDQSVERGARSRRRASKRVRNQLRSRGKRKALGGAFRFDR
jgi:hypothetical protein